MNDISEEESTIALLRDGWRSHLSQSIERVLRRVFQERKTMWVESLVHRFPREGLRERTGVTEGDISEALWIPIGSLSQLRKEVGGRFQNLRTRWLEAGFPLKAHRGESSEEYEKSEEGWLEMTSWLVKQGYESRILQEVAEGYFEIRKRSE